MEFLLHPHGNPEHAAAGWYVAQRGRLYAELKVINGGGHGALGGRVIKLHIEDQLNLNAAGKPTLLLRYSRGWDDVGAVLTAPIQAYLFLADLLLAAKHLPLAE